MLRVTIYPCRTAAERQEAHRIERELAVGKLCLSVTQVQDRLRKVVPQLRDPFMAGEAVASTEVRRTERSVTVVVHKHGRAFLSITEDLS